MHLLSNGHKAMLRRQAIQGARNYRKYLSGKVFRIICEDGTETDLRFFNADFKHLTGLSSGLNPDDFYNNCVSGIISANDIDACQKYNWATLKSKGRGIEKIHELLYKDCQKTLLAEMLVTHTYVFPYAVKNMANNMCVGFVSGIHKARSLRKASSPASASAEKTIAAIFARPQEARLFTELVYMSDTCSLYGTEKMLPAWLEGPVRERLLGVIRIHKKDA